MFSELFSGMGPKRLTEIYKPGSPLSAVGKIVYYRPRIIQH